MDINLETLTHTKAAMFGKFVDSFCTSEIDSKVQPGLNREIYQTLCIPSAQMSRKSKWSSKAGVRFDVKRPKIET